MSSNPLPDVEATVPVLTHCPESNSPLNISEEREAELWLYRERTIGVLKQYLRFSIEVGRLPSILGREFFRTKVSSYHTQSFEDAVIFVHDVEHILEHLTLFHQQIVAVVIFQDYTKEQAADVLRCARKTVSREFPIALDCISEMFLEGGLLNRLPPLPVEKTCQEGQSHDFLISDCKQAE